MTTRTITEVINEMNTTAHGRLLVRDWRDQIPRGSRWNPGDPGNPACTVCDGTGWLRLDGLSISNPNFGRLFFCECVNNRMVPAQSFKPAMTDARRRAMDEHRDEEFEVA